MKRKKLTEIYGLKNEGPFDDVQNQLNRAQSLRGGPRTEPGVRKHQDRAKRHSPDTARAQSDIDSARSIFDEGSGGDVTITFTSGEIATLIKMAQRADSVPGVREIGNKIRGAAKVGSEDTPFSSHAVGGLKLQ